MSRLPLIPYPEALMGLLGPPRAPSLSDNIKPILLSGWMFMLISSAFWSPVGINPHSLPMLIMPVANWLIRLFSAHTSTIIPTAHPFVLGQHLLFLCGRIEINEWKILWSGTSLCLVSDPSLWAWNHFLRIPEPCCARIQGWSEAYTLCCSSLAENVMPCVVCL